MTEAALSEIEIFFVDDEAHLRNAASQTLELADMQVRSFDTADAALKALSETENCVLVTDIKMPGMDGTELLAEARSLDPELPVIMITGHGDVELAVSCIKNGAYDFIEKPWQPAKFVACVKHAAERRLLTLENRALRAQVLTGQSSTKELYGRSAPMNALRQKISAVAQTDVDVLITGETGTGKEIVARLLHAQSERSEAPFVHINCAALPEALIESELFGHEAGAFPGALRARFGKLEHARGGIVCLDEIDSLSLPMQAKLLDVLHNRSITRLGSNDPVKLDIRVIALAKSDLEKAAEAQTFRPDLLYRLNVATIDVPPLTQRREDIPGLFSLAVAEIAQANDLPAPEVPIEMLGALAARDWPGNVRELRNLAERFVLGLSEILDTKTDTPNGLNDLVNAYEKAILSAAIATHGGKIKETYESLGLSRRTLYDKMQKHGLSRDDHTG